MWTNVSKPAPVSYTNPAKPTLGYAILKGMVTGLIMPVTYSTTQNFGNSWTNVSKPSAGSWTNIIKPT